MNFKTLLLSFFIGLVSTTVVAGSGHDHGHGHSHGPVDQDTAILKATKIVKNLVTRKTIEKSWSDTKLSLIEKKVFNGKAEWVAMFVNNNVADVKKRKLYIFLTIGGDYIAANYTGQ